MPTENYQTPPRVSVSSWAVHPLLAHVYPGRPGDPDAFFMDQHKSGLLDLREVPARLAALHIQTMEICHFHLLQHDGEYLDELRAALDAAGVELWSLLIDDGDITHPQNGERDRDWIRGWVDTAAQLGAKRVRVIAGKQPATTETLARGRAHFAELATYAESLGLRAMTENWFALLSNPDALNRFLESLDGHAGLCLDFGNWDAPTKYDDLAAIASWAESCHAKCNFRGPDAPETADFRRCLDLTRAAGFSGPYTLVAAEPSNIWGSIALQRDLIAPYLSAV